MVAAGATVLMAASEESSSNGMESNSRQASASKRNSPSSNTSRSNARLERSGSRASPRSLDGKEGSKIVSSTKTTPIRETKASRLRAASIVSPNSGTTTSKRTGTLSTAETSGGPWNPHTTAGVSSNREESPMSSDSSNIGNVNRERDKSYKRKSYLNRSHNTEAVLENSHPHETAADRRNRRLAAKSTYISESISSERNHTVSSPSTVQKRLDSRTSPSQRPTKSRIHQPTSNIPTRSAHSARISGDGPSASEVSRRVDALTALTKATMERVERLTSRTGQRTSQIPTYTNPQHEPSVLSSPSKSSILKRSNEESTVQEVAPAIRNQQIPVSILKHKTDGESSNSNHAVTPPVTFSPSVIEPTIYKRHGILKKRSSLDENEILRRRSCSPDVTFAENNENGSLDFRPILKNQQRRSSLDEIIRVQSPDQQHPASILKRKSSREDDREERNRQTQSPEPQGILKRKSSKPMNFFVSDSIEIESNEVDRVRPILKKKQSKEESSNNEPTSEPRPILKKKSSVESDEFEEKPKKTILKSTRKSSQEDSSNEGETVASPKKLSMLRNRSRCSGFEGSEGVRPILKSSFRDADRPLRFSEDYQAKAEPRSEDLFLRKRAQSVGHVQTEDSGRSEFSNMKRNSFETASLRDIRHSIKGRKNLETDAIETVYVAKESPTFSQGPTKGPADCEQESLESTRLLEKERYSSGASATGKFQAEPPTYSKTTEIKSVDKSDTDSDFPTMESEVNVRLCNKNDGNSSDSSDAQDTYLIRRSNSVSKMTMHFKALEEKAKSNVVANKESTQKSNFKGSRGIQRYRERKEQCSDRFNTQPVTYQEVQEAKLQNQRNLAAAAAAGAGSKDEDEMKPQSLSSNDDDDGNDPSKLSLAERVRLFNQKISNDNTNARNDAERNIRRSRPATRYKTQPVTSEEVEVASSRIASSFTSEISGHISTDSQRPQNPQTVPTKLSNDVPKSILKSSLSSSSSSSSTTASQQILQRSKSPELEGLRLIKSVLKREFEEQQQQQHQYQQQQPPPQNSDSCDIYPRSILKTNAISSSVRLESDDATTMNPSNHDNRVSLEDEKTLKASKVAEDDDVLGNQTVPSFQKSITTQDHPASLESNINDNYHYRDKIQGNNNINIDKITFQRPKRMRDQLQVANDEEGIKSSDDETSSGSREVRSIIKNEAIQRRRQAAIIKQARYNALSKSMSHHALSNDNNELSNTNSRGGKTIPKQVLAAGGIALPGLCRSATQPMPGGGNAGVDVTECPSMSIADRLAALQRSGSTDWKKRVTYAGHDPKSIASINKDIENNDSATDDSTIKQGVLANCLEKLESATEGWRKRIAAPDAVKFSVAGKMKIQQASLHVDLPLPLIEASSGINIAGKKKKTPRAERFRGKRGLSKDTSSTPTSPCKEFFASVQGGSYSEPTSDDSGEDNRLEASASTVFVPRADDETFTSFFESVSVSKCQNECLDISEYDFDTVTSYSQLLAPKRTVRTQKRRIASRNPLKVLAARSDIKSEYTEVRTGVAEKVMRQMNIEKLTKNSSLAVEALAGLASTEDFSAITLRNTADSNISINKLRPYKDLMLILVKGRRHVQVRLVEPVASSINSGDTYILVTKSDIFNYIGKYSNVIERARAAEIAASIQQKKDLGCHACQVITISEEKPMCAYSQVRKFWRYLGIVDDDYEVIDAGHPDEDELYESAVIDTNMVYEIRDEELVPLDKYWGAVPKIEMLDPSKILVFDFGSEMYIWNGKTAPASKKKIAAQLVMELWEEGYDYTDCAMSPINASIMIGRRRSDETTVINEQKKSHIRPKWCLLGKLTQHVETVLFREKFLDWPNVSTIIKVRKDNDNGGKEQTDGTIIIEPSDVKHLIRPNSTPVDLILEGSHLGRGVGWYDDELMRQFVVSTINVTVWHIDEFSYTLLDTSSVGQFFSADSYIVRWMYTVTVTGRELNGQPSKHAAKGRDRTVYFIWQGQNASLNEQGAAALLTIELDRDQGPQVRLVQGYEPAAFLNLFSGKMIVHNGKRTDDRSTMKRWRLYICRGAIETEASLFEVPCSTRQLRSRGSLVLIDTEERRIYVWHGSNSLSHIRKNALNAATALKENRNEETGLSTEKNIEIHEINEGEEPDEFFTALGGMNKKLYVPLTNNEIQDHSPRLFHLSSITKEFKEFQATEVLCPHRADDVVPFPFLQDDLYQANQPALFLLDNKNELWLWQGWWPDDETEEQTGSKAVRYQAERRAAMTMAIEYWKSIHPDATTDFPVYLVWAGLEPLKFTNLFPTWTYRDDIAELNIEDGRKTGEVLSVEDELARLTQSTYPPAQLLQRPLPEGVDPTRLENYLSSQHFQELLGMSKEEFQELPVWKQTNLKKDIGLF